MNRDKRLDWIRGILTILVIIGHSTFYRIVTKFGGIDYEFQLQLSGLKNAQVYFYIDELKNIIYKFHMPAFIVLSGILFGVQFRNGKFKSFSDLLESKVKRLVVPLLLTWLLWNIPIKYISNYYVSVHNSVASMITQILNPYQVHLWYLEALFLIFLLFYMLCRYVKNEYTRIGICFMFYALGVLVRYKWGAPLGNPFLYMIWFEVGFDKIGFSKFERIPAIVCAILFGCCYIMTKYIRYSWVALDLVLGYLGFIYLYKLSENKTGTENKIMSIIIHHSFGLYLLSDPINYVIIMIYTNIFGIAALSNNAMSVVLFLSRIAITTLIPILLIHVYDITSSLITKCKKA